MNTATRHTGFRRTISATVLAGVVVFALSTDLYATDYLFGIQVSSNRVYMGIPENPGSSGYCTQVDITDPSSLQRCVWHCVSSKGGTTASTIKSSGSTGSYLYVEVGGTKYWLRQADDSDPIRYTTSSSNSYDFIFDSTGLAENDNNPYYVYRKTNDGYFYSSSSSSTYKGKLLTIGSCTYVSTTKENTGYVYVVGDKAYSSDFSSKEDIAKRTAGKSGSTYYIYAKPASGYYFKGWSKSNSFTSIDIAATNKSGRNENSFTLNESSGYHASYYAMYAPYWKFSASGEATDTGGGTVAATVAKSEIEASNNSSTSASTTATFTATANSGYEFVGWTDTKSGTTVTQGTANPKTGVTVTNSTPGSTATKTLYAIFKPLTYTVSFINTNSLATGTMADVTFNLGQDHQLPLNQFVYGFTVTFDANGGTIDGVETKSITSSSFSRWIGNDGNYYSDGQTINKTGINSLKLTTVWHADEGPKYKAPFNPSVPVRGDRQCTGWHWQRYVVNKKADAGVQFWMYENGKTLYAQWGSPFYAKVNLTATSGAASAAPTVDVAQKESDYKNADISFTLSAKAANPGYRFTGWTCDKSVNWNGHQNDADATVTVKSSSTAGAITEYNFVANYEVEYKAQLTIAMSSLSPSSSSTAQVSADNSNWSSSVTISKNTPNTSSKFYLKAVPASQYKFVGWSETNGSDTVISGLGATGEYNLKTSSTAGGTNSKTLYAVFRKEYTIVINASSASSSSDRIVFTVTPSGSSTALYRVSVPVGGSVTLKDVEPGNYTIAAETAWSWNYTVSPASQSSNFDASTKISTNSFTVTSKHSTKKHDETSNTITP